MSIAIYHYHGGPKRRKVESDNPQDQDTATRVMVMCPVAAIRHIGLIVAALDLDDQEMVDATEAQIIAAAGDGIPIINGNITLTRKLVEFVTHHAIDPCIQSKGPLTLPFNELYAPWVISYLDMPIGEMIALSSHANYLDCAPLLTLLITKFAHNLTYGSPTLMEMRGRFGIPEDRPLKTPKECAAILARIPGIGPLAANLS